MLCQDCPTKSTCKEICKELKKFLPKDSDGRIKDEHGKWVEFSFDPKIIDSVPFTNREKGIRKKKYIYGDNWDSTSS